MQDDRVHSSNDVHASAPLTGESNDTRQVTATHQQAQNGTPASHDAQADLKGDGVARQSQTSGDDAALDETPGTTAANSTRASHGQAETQVQQDTPASIANGTGSTTTRVTTDEGKLGTTDLGEPTVDTRHQAVPDKMTTAESTGPSQATSTSAATVKPTLEQTLSVKDRDSRTTSPAPPGPSISPAPTKKFQSSLAVNKKFLEKAADKTKPEVKAPQTAIRLATPPIPTPVSTSHPRLLTGKISTTAPSASQSGQTQATPTPTGWRAPVTDASLPRPTPQRPGEAFSGRDGPASTYGSFGGGTGRSGVPVWAPKGASGGRGTAGWSGGDFPTAAEAARAKDARAQAIAEQMAAKEKALQARAAANAHLLEQLDTFRGVHLDPNAAHWDEDDDDFLDDTIEFGDGTQYKISEVDSAKLAAEAQLQQQNAGDLREPNSSDLAKLEEPLKPGESQSEMTRAERFKDDYDRTWRTHSGNNGATDSSRTLYNDRLGRLELYAGEKRDRAGSTGGSTRASAPATTQRVAPANQDTRTRRPSNNAVPPKQEAKPPAVNPWNLPSTSSTSSARRPSMDAGPRRASVDAHAGRQLPPHMAAAAQNARSPPASVAQTLKSPPKPSAPPLVAAPAAEPIKSPETAVEPDKPDDIETVHAREMHAAAERAKKRREEEERQRLEQIERARKKAAELEAKQKMAEEEAAAKLQAERAASAEKLEEVPDKQAPSATEIGAAAPADRAESWRRQQPLQPVVSTTSPSSQTKVVSPTSEPKRILTRDSSGGKGQPTSPNGIAEQTRPPPAKISPQSNEQSADRTRRQSEYKPQDATSTRSPPNDREARKGRNSVTKVEGAASTQTTKARQASTIPSVDAVKFVVPEVAHIDDVMTKIQGALREPAATEGQTKQAASDLHTIEKPTVRLPTKPQRGPTSVDTSLEAPNDKPSVKLPKTKQASQAQLGRGRQEIRRTSTSQPPHSFEAREPIEYFDRSRTARSPSPAPAWRLYAVRAPSSSTFRRRTPVGKVRAFEDPAQPFAVRPLSWEPPLKYLGPNLSRDELIIPRVMIKGKIKTFVKAPRRRIQRQSEIEWVEKPRSATLEQASPKREPKAVDGILSYQNEELDDQLDATTVPSVAALFDLSPGTDRVSTPADTKSSSITSAAPSVAHTFDTFRPATHDQGSRSRMVTGELDGEVVKTGRREPLTAPGADLGPLRKSATPPPTDHALAHSVTMTPSGSNTWTTKGPLSLAVLDPTVPSVWSATPGETPAHSRSISHGANTMENSLHGLADDDFPAAVMPTSLAELKSEDEVSNEDRDVPSTPAQLRKDEARLRAAAPSFSSFNPHAGVFEQHSSSSGTPMDTVSNPYTMVGRQESPAHVVYPSQPTPQQILYSQSTSPMMMHAGSSAYTQPAQAYAYSSSVTATGNQGQTYSAAQQHSYYPNAAISYRSPIMSVPQSAVYAGYGSTNAYSSLYGAVGAVGQRTMNGSGGGAAGAGHNRMVGGGYRDISAGPYGTHYHHQSSHQAQPSHATLRYPRALSQASATSPVMQHRHHSAAEHAQSPAAQSDSHRYDSVSPVIMHQQLPPNLAETLAATSLTSSVPRVGSSEGPGGPLYGAHQAAFRRSQWAAQNAAATAAAAAAQLNQHGGV
ncbi:hypothetical protein OIO90_005003 [Microbotryomycetes sp. JL221]|nr:hypothetical protein OIO90_005003 [Microbotryomycetes sp. JL221]